MAKKRGLSKTEINKYRKKLDQERLYILNKGKVLRADFHIQTDDLMDEADLASSDIDQNMLMRLGNRENLYLKKIDQALERIADDVYGECVTCGEDVGIKRLDARPTAELCIVCKEEEEKRENLSAHGRKPKSLGASLGHKLGLG